MFHEIIANSPDNNPNIFVILTEGVQLPRQNSASMDQSVELEIDF